MDFALNRILAVPNWSFYDPKLCDLARGILAAEQVQVHYCQGDVDHQRSVIAFSGQQADVFRSMDNLAENILPLINMNVQNGVHPRVGALDVAPFVLLNGSESALIEETIRWASHFSLRFDLPVHLYEKAARAGQEVRLPHLRGQLGELIQLPDFGTVENSQWGTAIVGVRNFLLAVNLNLVTGDIHRVRQVAKELRFQRDRGREELKGVRALAFDLKSRGMTQLSLNLTEPDSTSFDAVFEIASNLLAEEAIFVSGTELIGVIRDEDLAGATLLTIDPSQVVR